MERERSLEGQSVWRMEAEMGKKRWKLEGRRGRRTGAGKWLGERESDVGEDQLTEWSNIVGAERQRKHRRKPKGGRAGVLGK
jgi:hypothetical protein